MQVKARKAKINKVAFFEYAVLEQGGGFENFIIETAPALAKLNPSVKFEVITGDLKMSRRLQKMLGFYYFKKQSVDHLNRESHESIQAKFADLVKYRQLGSLRSIKRNLAGYDLLHVKNEILELFILRLFGFKNLPPIVMGIHTPVYYPYADSLQSKFHNIVYGFLYPILIKQISAIYVQNYDDKAILKDKFKYKGRLEIIDQGIDFKAKIRRSKEGSLTVLFVGRLTEQKGLDYLIEVIQTLLEVHTGKSFNFLIAGSGDTDIEADVVRLTNKYKQVVFLGHIEHTDVAELYSKCDVVIVPSRYETLCKTAIEAGLSGKIVVASDIPGPREVILDQETGFLVPLKSNNFVQCLSKLYELKISDLDSFNQIGERAMKRLSVKYNKKSAHQKFSNLFMEVMR